MLDEFFDGMPIGWVATLIFLTTVTLGLIAFLIGWAFLLLWIEYPLAALAPIILAVASWRMAIQLKGRQR